MAYLQLADNAYSHLAAQPNKFYVFVPEGFRGALKDSYIREDIFDSMDPDDYAQVMRELAPYQNTGLSGKDDRASRKAARATKKETQGAGARRDAKAARQSARQTAKTARAAAGGGFGGVLNKIGGIAKDILGKDVQVDAGGLQIDYQAPQDEESFFQKYKWPILIGGGAVLIGGVYMLTKKKKRKKNGY